MKSRLTLLFSMALLLSACSLYPARPPQPALHDFGPVPVAMAGAGSSINMDAPAWLRDERIRYRMLYNDPTQVRFYLLDSWLAAPPALLAQQFSSVLSGSKARLQLTLTEFEQVFDDPNNAHIVLSFRAHMEPIEANSASAHLFQYNYPCPSADAKGAVSAYALAVAQALIDVRHWLSVNYRDPVVK